MVPTCGMDKKCLVVSIQNKGIRFNQELIIPWSQTNIPPGSLTFNESEPIFWLISMLHYETENATLHIEVKSYQADGALFENRKNKKALQRVEIARLNWAELHPQLSAYHKLAIKPLLENEEAEWDGLVTASSVKNILRPPTANDELLTSITQIISSDHQYWEISEKVKVGFDEATFSSGAIKFTKHLVQIKQDYEFSIPNEHLLPEFEAIKSWFVKRLNSGYFIAELKIKLQGQNILCAEASSAQIRRINQDFISGVKTDRILGLPKEPRVVPPDKQLFTNEDIFSDDDGSASSGALPSSEHEILNALLSFGKIRNRKQLEFLAGVKQEKGEKIRFTQAPEFGFLFLVKGPEANHFIWELLNSNATYIWSLNGQALAEQYRLIEQIINSIRLNGRRRYKQYYQTGQADYRFNVIKHEKISSDLVDDFPRWKAKLEGLLY